MKIVLAEVPYTKDRDISVEKSCVPEGAELTMASISFLPKWT